MTSTTGTESRNGSGTAAAPVPVAPGTGTVPGSTPSVPAFRWWPLGIKIGGGTRNGTAPSSVPVPVPASPRHAVPESNLPAPAAENAKPSALRTWLKDNEIALWLAIGSVTAVATWMAATGQVDVWTWAGEDPKDTRRFGVPFLFEVGVIAWLLLGRLAIRNRRSPYPYWGMAAIFSGLSVFTNAVHGEGDNAWRAGLIFGTASALSLALWFAKFYIDFVGSEIQKGLRAGTAPKVLLTPRAIEQPRIRWRAHLIAGAIPETKERDADGKMVARPLTLADVIALAGMWIEIYQDTKTAQKKNMLGLKFWQVGDRQLAKRLAWREVKIQCGVKVKEATDIRLARVNFVRPEVEAEREQLERDRAEQERIAAELEKLRQEEAERLERERAALAADRERMARDRARERTELPNRDKTKDRTPPPLTPLPANFDEAWLKTYGTHIVTVKNAVTDWQTRAKPLNADEIQALGKDPKYQGKGLARRENAVRIAACLKHLRGVDDNQTAGT